MRPKALVIAGTLMLCGPALADGENLVSNWPAPPYWTAPAAKAERSALAASTPLPFVALFPCRLVDTRAPVYPAPLGGGYLPAATVRTYTLTGVCNLPANAKAVSLNATVVNPAGPGFLTLYPEGGAFPPVSTLNFLGHDVIVNAAVVPLSATGGISMALGVSGGDVVLDTNGYYAEVSGVKSLNAQTGDLNLVAGANVTITPAGSTLTIASTAAGGPPTGPAGGGLSGSYPNPTVVSTSANTANSIVSRDGTGSFEAGSLGLAGGIQMYGAPFLFTGGSSNIFLGMWAGNLSNTGGNTGMGYISLQSVSTGIANTANGFATLSSNTAGNLNTALGSAAMNANTTSSANTAVGYFALNEQSFSNSGGEWNGLNTAVGSYALLHTNSTNAFNATENTAVGAHALEANTTGFQNTALGSYAGFRSGFGTGYVSTIAYDPNTTGNYNTFVGRGTGATSASVFNCTAVGIDAYCDGNNQVRLGNPYVGSIGGKVGWSALSDARAKRDIRDLDLGLDFVLSLRPVEYTLKLGNGRRDLGFLAQDVEALLGDDYNVVTVGGDPARTLSLRYTDLIAPVVKAIQEQEVRHRADVETLRTRIEELEHSLAVLGERRPSR